MLVSVRFWINRDTFPRMVTARNCGLRFWDAYFLGYRSWTTGGKKSDE